MLSCESILRYMNQQDRLKFLLLDKTQLAYFESMRNLTIDEHMKKINPADTNINNNYKELESVANNSVLINDIFAKRIAEYYEI